jgi:hypothetical protein
MEQLSVPLRNDISIQFRLALSGGNVDGVEYLIPTQAGVRPRGIGDHDVRNGVERKCIDARATVFRLDKSSATVG